MSVISLVPVPAPEALTTNLTWSFDDPQKHPCPRPYDLADKVCGLERLGIEVHTYKGKTRVDAVGDIVAFTTRGRASSHVPGACLDLDDAVLAWARPYVDAALARHVGDQS